MKNYAIYSPSRIFGGPGSVRQLPDIVKEWSVNRLLLVTDKGLRQAGIVDQVLDLLDDKTLRIHVFDETKPEPTVGNYESALHMAKEENIELVIGLGGGSAIDLAKAVALSMVHAHPFLDLVGINKVPGPGLPTVLISTTSGTGTEVSKFAVLTDEETSLKSVIASPHVLASVAIVDPELTLTLPPVITSHTGIDAMVHAIEGYLAVRSSPYTDQLALLALDKLWNNIKKTYENGNDLSARTEMAVGSMMGGMVLNTTDGAGMVHGLAFSLGVYYQLSHGLSNSLVLPYVLETIAPLEKEKMMKLAKVIGIEEKTKEGTINAFIQAIVELQKSLDLPTTLKEIGVDRSQLKTLAKSSFGMERLQSNSPKRLSEAEILDIFDRSYTGELLLQQVNHHG